MGDLEDSITLVRLHALQDTVPVTGSPSTRSETNILAAKSNGLAQSITPIRLSTRPGHTYLNGKIAQRVEHHARPSTRSQKSSHSKPVHPSTLTLTYMSCATTGLIFDSEASNRSADVLYSPGLGFFDWEFRTMYDSASPIAQSSVPRHGH